MTRDRFREYQERVRQQQQRQYGDAIVVDPSTLGSYDDHNPIDILQQTDEVRQSINRLEDRIRVLNQKQAGVMSQTVVSPRQKYELEQAIDEIKVHINELRPRIREIDLAVRNFEKEVDPSGAQLRIRRNQCDQLKRRLQDVLLMFNNTQTEYKRRVSQRVKRQLDLAGQGLTSSQVEEMIESNSEEVFYREINPISASAQAALEDATNRHNEILRLERSIRELNELFVEVYELDNLVNNISRNVEDAKEYTRQGHENTVKAVVYKKKAQRKMLIMVLVGLTILIALVVIIIIMISR